jgi:hypothetical protein
VCLNLDLNLYNDRYMCKVFLVVFKAL